VLLASFELLDLTVGDPFRKTLQVGAEKIAYAIGIFEGLDVDGQRGKDLKNSI
jgi:hypothetical protein